MTAAAEPPPDVSDATAAASTAAAAAMAAMAAAEAAAAASQALEEDIEDEEVFETVRASFGVIARESGKLSEDDERSDSPEP